MKYLRVGLLGASCIAPEAIIGPSRVIPSVKIVGIAARNVERAKVFAQEHNIGEVFEDYGVLLDSSEVDLVYISLPVHSHAQKRAK